MIGSTIGNYQVVRRLGEGGMGTVYAAIDLMLEREVALKVLRPELAGQADIADRFRAEAVTLARLQHPHIATLYSLAREAGELMMVMELVDGDTLERILQRTGPLPAGTAVRWCREVLEAMAYAHRKGVVHRDIKPANVMITTDGTVKVTDFGIAHVLGGTHRTRTGHIIGTAAYMAPEQIRGREVDARTDIYALASVLFELLTGRPPFEAEDEFGLMTAQVTGAPPSARALGAQVPQWLDEAILRGLAKAPDARFQTATAFGDVLAEGLRASALPDAEPGVFLPAATAPADRDLNTGDPPTTRLAATPHPTAPGLASAHTTPPTRLAAPPAASMSWPASQVSPTQVAGAPAPEPRDAAGGLARLNWRHYTGASAVLLLLVAAAVTWLGPSLRKPAVDVAPPPAVRGAAPVEPPQPPPSPQPTSTPAVSAPVELARVEPPQRIEPEVPLTRPVLPVRTAAPQKKTVASPPPGEVPAETAPRQPLQGRVPSEPGTPPPTEPSPPSKADAVSPPKPDAEAVAPADTPPSTDTTYRNVSWTVAEGDESDLAKVVMEFRHTGLTLRPTDSDLPARTIPYATIVGVTYSQTRPSRLRRLLLLQRKDQHWLELRMKDGQALLRLESNNYRTIIADVEKRTGLTTAR